MTASFAAGALSGDRGPETIPIPETGLTVVLPESWRGKCGYDIQNGALGVYLRAARTGEGLDEAGYLFTVECHEGSCDPQRTSPPGSMSSPPHRRRHTFSSCPPTCSMTPTTPPWPGST